MKSKIKDIRLAEQGEKNIEFAELQMKGLMSIRERFKKEKPLSGYRIGLCLHITKETAVLVKTLAAGGAEIAITASNPLSTQDDVTAALASQGFDVFGWKGQNKEEYYENINHVLDTNPNITIDDGCDLVTEIHTKRKGLLKNIIGGSEETTTGVVRLRAMEKEGVLKYPMIAVNDSNTKHLFDNYIGTGQSTIDGIMRATNILIAGKSFVVVGFGNCGKGVAIRAKGMGANVIICESNPFRALQAYTEGYRVMPISEAAEIGDIFITVTGNKNVISLEDMKRMKDGAILANSGHFNVEIDLDSLDKQATKRNIRPSLEEYKLNGKRIFVLAEGRLVNLSAAEGHPSEIMSLSFMNQALAAEYIVKNRGKLQPKVYKLPEELDMQVAITQLESLGVKINQLTQEQKKYMESWNEGT
jgi:adenosylhomocysteinase